MFLGAVFKNSFFFIEQKELETIFDYQLFSKHHAFFVTLFTYVKFPRTDFQKVIAQMRRMIESLVL